MGLREEKGSRAYSLDAASLRLWELLSGLVSYLDGLFAVGNNVDALGGEGHCGISVGGDGVAYFAAGVVIDRDDGVL